MLSEDQSSSSDRCLYIDSVWSDGLIKAAQHECIKRFADREKDAFYHRFITWKRTENEMAVFTLYAYADLSIPKSFDCIFRIDNPRAFVNVSCQLTQSIWEVWAPLGSIDHGHKHLVILEFENKVPDIFRFLLKG